MFSWLALMVQVTRTFELQALPTIGGLGIAGPAGMGLLFKTKLENHQAWPLLGTNNKEMQNRILSQNLK